MHTVVFGWFGASAVWFIPLFWRLVKAALPGGAGLRGPGTIRLWLGFVCVMVASSTLEASLLNVTGENGLGHALASGFGHLLGHIGTPLVALALFVVSLPWLIDFRWRDFLAWADGAFGLGLSRGLAKRDEDARRHRSADDGLPQHVSPSVNTMAPRSNGRYARPTVWRPPSSGRAGASSSSSAAALNTATGPGSGYAPPGRDANARGTGWRAGAERTRRPLPQTEPVLRTGAIAPGRAAPLHAPDTNHGANQSATQSAKGGLDRSMDKANKASWIPTEPIAPAGWLRDPSARGAAAAASAGARAASTSRVAARPDGMSGATPGSMATTGREGTSQIGRRTAGDQRQTGSVAGAGAAMAGAAGLSGTATAAGFSGAASVTGAATAAALQGAAAAGAGMTGRPISGGTHPSSTHSTGATVGVGRPATVQRVASPASAAGQAASARQPLAGTPRAGQTTGQPDAQPMHRTPTPAPSYTRPMATTQKVTPPASVQETLRSIAENAARWTDIASVSLARSSNVNGGLDSVKMTPPPETGPATSMRGDATLHPATSASATAPVAPVLPEGTIEPAHAHGAAAHEHAPQRIFSDTTVQATAPAAPVDDAVTTNASSEAQVAPGSDDVPVVQWPIEPPVFHPPVNPATTTATVTTTATTITPTPGSDQGEKPVAAAAPDRNGRDALASAAHDGNATASAHSLPDTSAPVETPVQTWVSPDATAASAPAAPAAPPVAAPSASPTAAPVSTLSVTPHHAARAATPTPFQIFAAQLESGDDDTDLSTLEDEGEPDKAQTSSAASDVTSGPQAVSNSDATKAPARAQDGHTPPEAAENTGAEKKTAPWEDASDVPASPTPTTPAPVDNAAHVTDVGQNRPHSPAPAIVVEPTPAPQTVAPTVEQTPPQAAPIAEPQPASNVVRFPHFAAQVAALAPAPADTVEPHNAAAATQQTQSPPAQATPAAPDALAATEPQLAGTASEAVAEPASQRAPLRGHGPASGFEFHAPAASMVELPTLDLLARADTDVEPVSEESLIETGLLIEQRLQEFKVPVTVVGHSAGPVITRFEVEPALGVRGSQIVGLMKDLSRGLGLTSIRVVETIPGKTCMGLELPNAKRQTIRLSEILEADVYQHSHSQLTLAMGKDITGHPVVADLAKAPHMLVAGTTGSGKSVAINAMICSLLYKATPEEVRLIMIDPKMLELSVYEGIPHLLAPVVTDMKLAANALNWCVGEMEKRYRLMSAVGVRNLAGFNQKIRDTEAKGKKLGNPFSLTPDAPEPLAPLPLIVVVIDELADLMMVAGKKIEELIARLAQKARAAGIHLILATQRPSVDVITGLIKANIPTRVAFQVSSKIDSRTILDQMGAESLLGQGDMLFLPPGTGYPQRVHGAFVADEEVHAIVEYLKQFGEPQYEEGILDGPATEGGATQDLFGESPEAEADPLYDEAVAFVVRTRRASISSVQRQLRIGYNRAARLVEQMETAGLVSAMGINGSREVLAPGPAE